MSSIRGKNTSPEIALRKYLWENNLRGYRLHLKNVPGRPDITFPGKKIAIFVNGCFWHRCLYCNPPMPKSHSKFWKEKFKKNIERDIRKIRLLNKEGWKTLVVWECQIKNNVNICASKIKRLISQI